MILVGVVDEGNKAPVRPKWTRMVQKGFSPKPDND